MNGSERAASDVAYKPSLPFPITCLSTGNSKRYMLYDIDLISWLRREHHILGALVGSLPQAPSQNVFLGLPLELMPEEAQLLVEKNLAVIVDDRAWYLAALRNGVTKSKIKLYQGELAQRGHAAAEAAQNAKDLKLEEAMRKLSLNGDLKQKQRPNSVIHAVESSPEVEDLLFEPKQAENASKNGVPQRALDAYAVTPTRSGAFRSDKFLSEIHGLDPSSYALFKTLHDKGYFLSPGLRFGCQYMAYPGDPLRYHSHFLAVSSDWDKPIDLIDIIGSGRLATGVKKSFLLGGIEPSKSEAKSPSARAFSFEWAGM